MGIENKDFPLYLMLCNNKKLWLSIQRAGVLYDCGHADVKIGGRVLESDGKERAITDEEQARISEIADEYSGSK
ncbi:MAG: hypothetical protein R3346_01020 [Candidatus Spechtbacterales bacterium]|nr:hypothetical protein [Candidatus Spechtbacterales bacterium]